MNSITTIAQSTEVHESLRHLFYADGEFDIRANFGGPALLPEGDAHWVNQDEVRRERPDVMGNDFYVTRVYDLRTGERMFPGSRAPEGWYPEQLGDWYDNLVRWGRSFPNTYVVNGDFLFVAGGAWVITGVPDAAGEVEFSSWSSLKDEMMREEQKRRAEWMAENVARIHAVRPDWADSSITWLDMAANDEYPDSMEFCRKVGSVKIEQAADVTGGVIFLIGEPLIRVTDQDEAAFDVDTARQVAADMAEAVALMVRS